MGEKLVLDITDEEVDIFLEESKRVIEDACSLNDSTRYYLTEIGQHPLLTADEEVSLALRLRGGDSSAKDILVISNLRLVVAVAKRYIKSTTFSLLDLCQEGNIGLMRAAEKYDPDMGYRFSTYATWWIKQTISRFVVTNQSAVRLPVHVGEGIKKIKRWASEYAQSNGVDPTQNEILDILPELGLPFEQYGAYIMCNSVISLDLPVGVDGSISLGEILEDTTTEGTEKSATDSLMHDSIMTVLEAHLSPREKEVICFRFGLYGETELTLDAIGQKWGLSRERIRQIEEKALTKLSMPEVKNLLSA